MDRLRAHARHELVLLALGTMDVCVITPLFAAFLSTILPVRPLPVTVIFLGAVMAAHYLARLALWLPVRSAVRSGLLGLGMLLSGLLAMHQLFYAQTRILDLAWLMSIFHDLRQANLSHQNVSRDVIVFLLVLFLWWRGLVLARRRLDGESVAFRFRLGLVMLAGTMVVGGVILPWPFHSFVFLFFFAALLGIALARVEEVGQQYGGSQSPFSLGWLATLVAASVAVLLLAAGVALLLTGENVSLFVRPALEVLRLVFLGIAYVIGLVMYVVVSALRFLIGEVSLEDMRRSLSRFTRRELLAPVARSTSLTPEQLALARTVSIIVAVLILIVVVVFSLRKLRARVQQRRDEERESVWEGANLRRGLRNLLQYGHRRLDEAAAALSQSLVGRFFAALTIRRIYAHVGALAAERGYPRSSYQTPYEYLPTLERAFPGYHQEIVCITEAYVGVHYGELPERPEDLAAVRAAWENIQEHDNA